MKQILDLDTLVERPKVRIRSERNPDGKLYGLRHPDDLSIVEQKRVSNRYRFVTDELSTTDIVEMSDEEAALISEALDEMVVDVMDGIEPEVRRALTDAKKQQIVEVWFREFFPKQAEALENGQDPT